MASKIGSVKIKTCVVMLRANETLRPSNNVVKQRMKNTAPVCAISCHRHGHYTRTHDSNRWAGQT